MRKTEVINAENSEELSTKVNEFYQSGKYAGTPRIVYDLSGQGQHSAIVDYEPKTPVRVSAAESRPNSPLWNAVGELETKLITDALVQSGGNKKEAAKNLGISRTALYNKLAEYDITITRPIASASDTGNAIEPAK